jgi:hypothetical protein
MDFNCRSIDIWLPRLAEAVDLAVTCLVPVFCLVLGFNIWWVVSPDLFIEQPETLCLPDLELLQRAMFASYNKSLSMLVEEQ